MNLGGIVGGVIGSSLAIAGMTYLVKRGKKNELTEEARIEFEKLEATYKKREIQLDNHARIFILFLMLPFCWLSRQLALVRLAQYPDAVVAPSPDPILSMGPGLFLAIVIGLVAGHYWTKLKLGPEYPRYKKYIDTKNRLLKRFVIIVCVLVTPMLLQMLLYYDRYLIIEPQRIVLNDVWSFGGIVLPFDQIVDIQSCRVARKETGERVTLDDPIYMIHFKSGRKLTGSDMNSLKIPWKRVGDVMEYISRQANVPIEKIPEIAWGDR